MRFIPRQTIAVCLTAALLASGPSQAAPRLRIECPSPVASGATVETAISLELEAGNVLGWSLGLFLEGLSAMDLSNRDTDFERLSRGGYAEHWIDEEGSRFASVGVLSFTEEVTLPPGISRVLVARCRVSRKDPGDARIEPRDGIEPPGGEGPIDNAVLIRGGAILPLEVHATTLQVLGCAELSPALEGREPASGPAPLEVRHDTPFGVDLIVRVASSSHLRPTGFSVALRHDPDILEPVDVVFLPELLNAFVAADGFSTAEISEDGLAALVVSSSSAPRALPTGAHRALRLSYALVRPGRPGDTFQTAIRFADEMPIGDRPTKNIFQPGDALPCELADLELELTVGPDWWIRGDVNSTGSVDISDAVVLLQHLFLGSGLTCLRAAEANSDGHIDLSDSIFILNHLFLGGRAPSPPYPACGTAEDTLPCAVFPCPA